MGETVRGLGEFGLIARLVGRLGPAGDADLIVGPGDDAAVWRNAGPIAGRGDDAGDWGKGSRYTIGTTDTMVDGVHFRAGDRRWRDVGWKALATNVSDVAAMGGTPRFALVTLCVPADTDVGDIDALYEGLRECAAAYAVTIAGGDVVSAAVFAMTIALVGDAAVGDDGGPLLLRRDAAGAGDVIAVTGSLGGSAGGLRAMVEGAERSDAVDRLVARHMRPEARAREGQAAIAAGVRCAIDVSDGLVQDLGHVCEASGVDAVIRLAALPIDADLQAAFPREAAAMAATGGEDYELVVVGGRDAIDAMAKTTAITVIGEITATAGGRARRVRCVDAAGRDVKLATAGWDHFAAGRAL